MRIEFFCIGIAIATFGYIKGQLRVKKQEWKNSQKILIEKHDQVTGEYGNKTEQQIIDDVNWIKNEKGLSTDKWRFCVPSGFGPKSYKEKTGFNTVSMAQDFYLEMI